MSIFEKMPKCAHNFIFSTTPGIIPIMWNEINHKLFNIGHEEYPIPGSGFCLIDSIVHILQVEYKMNISIENVKELIQNQALEEHGKYINFHAVNKPQNDIPKYITEADLFLGEIIDFFNNHDYTKDVVDLIIKIAADALGINVMVYQENEGITQLLEITCGLFDKKVFLKFRQNDLHPQGNHYNPIILSQQKNIYDEKCKNNLQNLQLLDNEQTNHQKISTPEQNQLETDKPEIRDDISTPTFEYEIAYYTKDHTQYTNSK